VPEPSTGWVGDDHRHPDPTDGDDREDPTAAVKDEKSVEERAAAVAAMAEQLNDAVTALTTSEAWPRMLAVAARFTCYSAQTVGPCRPCCRNPQV
jgi:hypothetical protein